MRRSGAVPSGRPVGYARAMPIRIRKLIGAILLVAFVVLYMGAAMELSAAWLREKPAFVQLLGYAAAGLLWIVPAGLIIRWMSRPDPGRG